MSRFSAVCAVIDAYVAIAPDPGVTTTQAGPLVRFQFDHRPRGVTDMFRAVEVEPAEAVRVIQSCRPGLHVIRVWTTDLHELIGPYERLGYRALPEKAVETVMARSLAGIVPGQAKHQVQQVQTEAQRRLYNTAFDPDLDPNDPHGPMKAEDLHDPALRHYFVEREGQCACYARVIRALPAAIVVEPLWTRPEHRRQGLATAVMSHLHAAAAAEGAEQCVIIASPMGVPLYTHLGYEVVALIQKFVPQAGLPR